MPIIARGKPYVSIRADHSDPGRILKYAPNPYLWNESRSNVQVINLRILSLRRKKLTTTKKPQHLSQ